MGKINEKGQYFSLDLLIAVGLAVLAMGMLLQFYELGIYQQKELEIQNELTIVGITASNILLETSNCTLDSGGSPSFADQGYKVFGCVDTSNFDSITKSDIMIPKKYSCNISWGKSEPTYSIDGTCEDTPTGDVKDIMTIERHYFTADPSIGKGEYESCIAGAGECTVFKGDSILEVKIWKEA